MKISIQITSGNRNDAYHLMEEVQNEFMCGTKPFDGRKVGSVGYQKGDRPMDSIYIMKAPGSYIYEVEEGL